MNTEEFLARVVPGIGNYASVGWFERPPGRKPVFITRSFPVGTGITGAANEVVYRANTGRDAYHALGSFITAEQKGQHTVAKRVVPNVHALKVIVIDLDVKASAYPDRPAALHWLTEFGKNAGLPRANLIVDSGYGFHCYWTLEQPLAVLDWKPLAEAMKNAALAHGFVGDTACTVDAARILRPPGTVNMKSGTPVPVSVLDRATLPDYANADIITALTPWMTQQQVVQTGTGGAAIFALGQRPGYLPPPDPENTTTGVGLPQPVYKYANIHRRCEQARKTVADRGAGQSRDHWALGDLLLLAHCADGDDWAHPISDGYKGYTAAETDQEYAARKQAVANGVGPTLCVTYNTYRAGVCDTCRFKGQISTPKFLGVDDDSLPYGFRRVSNPPRIQMLRDKRWETMIEGDLTDASVRELDSGGHELAFTYTYAGKTNIGAICSTDVASPKEILAKLTKSNIAINAKKAGWFGDFTVAWINKIRFHQQPDDDLVLRPFGWMYRKGKHAGITIAGTIYNADGTTGMMFVEDKQLVTSYSPHGDEAGWRAAAALFENGPAARPGLQGIIACAFAAPLVALASDINGMTVNFWSPSSGAGKSAAIKVGQSVWGNCTAISSMKDTANAVMRSLSAPRILPRYWDEFQKQLDSKDNYAELVDLIFTIPQGRERKRLTPDIKIREVGEWETLLITASNTPLTDALFGANKSTDAGVLRVLDIPMDKQQIQHTSAAGVIIKGCEANYGHVGRTYAAYIAQNVDGVRAALIGMMDHVNKDMQLQQEERYYATAIATMIVGAGIATKLGLFKFDVNGIYDMLKLAVLDARKERSRRAVVMPTGKLDIGALLSAYINQMGEHRLVTDYMISPGGGRKVNILPPQPSKNIIYVRITQHEVRLEVQHLESWLRRQNMSITLVLAQMKRDWNARVWRAVIAQSTQYATGQVNCLEIMRGPPELESIFETAVPP